MAVDLYCGDCRDVLPTLPDASVDAIVTDPPYGQSNESYDRGVLPEVWRECFRVAKPDAALISFAGSPTYHRIVSGIEAAGWRVRQMWAWVYRDGMITSAYPKEGFDRLAPAMDPICYATRGKVLLNLEREGDAEWSRPNPAARGYSGRSNPVDAVGSQRAVGRWPRTIVSDGSEPFEYFDLPRGGRKPDISTGHPNQKPLALMRWLVSKLPPGGTILDPYAGSATTLIAASELGFSVIGIESNPAYFDTAARRIEAEGVLLAPPLAPLSAYDYWDAM
jgi:DNA modification methylase